MALLAKSNLITLYGNAEISVEPFLFFSASSASPL